MALFSCNFAARVIVISRNLNHNYMEKMLLNPWALDENGNFVSIEHAQKNQEYFCPTCHQPLTYRKKGDGPRAHQDHFSHKSKSKCTGPSESDIHKFAKQGVFEILQSAIENHRDLPISWTCPKCGMIFKANLLKKAKSVQMEKDLDVARPDVALFDENGNVVVAIEIVFTHDVEDNTMRFYDDNGIVLVRIVVHSAEECNNLMQKLQYPDSVNVCFNKSCPRCQSTRLNRGIFALRNENSDGIVGLAVGFSNPFGDEPILGLSFTEQDKLNAITITQKQWPGYQLHFNETHEFPHAVFVSQQQAHAPSQRSYRPRPHYPTLEQIQHQKQVKAIRRSYAIRSKSAKKSGGKRRR